ncbi:MAG: mechanosensitive ion channel [Betaproteobacteria bacterium]|nr:mechanosensitive ion channel [Betaproteobacteria bacterium]
MSADLEKLLQQLTTSQGLVEIAIVGAGFFAGWLVSQPLKSKLPSNLQPGALKIGAGSLHRIAFPLAALIAVWMARFALAKWQPVPILNVAVPLIATFAAIRLAIYLLRHALPPSAALKASERLIFYAVWGAVALYLTGVLPEVKAALEDVSFTANKQKITLFMILQALFWAVVTIFAALSFSRIIEQRLMAASGLDLSMRVFASKMIRALAVVVGVLIALPIVGIDITVLSVFGGALGVGLGLGMQKIASNYVSGFAILLDRSIRPGDLVTIADRHGIVTDIKTRYTVVKSLDGTEAIIPNDTVATTTVINHSNAGRAVAIKVPFCVPHSADLSRVMELGMQAAQRQKRVLADPKPAVNIVKLAETTVECELVVWIGDAELGFGALKSDIFSGFLQLLSENKLKLAQDNNNQLVAKPSLLSNSTHIV